MNKLPTSNKGITLLVLAFLLFFTTSVSAAIPENLNYQGKLKDNVGTPITTPTTIQFSIYNHLSNGAPTDVPSSTGPLLWTEIYDQAVGNCMQIDPDASGIFGQRLATCVVFPAYMDFTDEYYIGVKVGVDGEATPRIPLSSNPYAHRAGGLYADSEDIQVETENSGNVVFNSAGNIQMTSNDVTPALIINQLGTGSLFEVQDNGVTSFVILDGGNVGIGTSTPRTALEIGGDGAILATGTHGAGWIEPDLGAGSRMMWYPRKSAFRAGRIDGVQWDDGNIGSHSFAVGHNTTASGFYSTAIGSDTIASGFSSTAMGIETTASGMMSTAIGYGIEAGANNVVAVALNDQTGTNCNQANSLCIMGGEVGIGTIAPSTVLHINSNGANTTAILTLENIAGDIQMFRTDATPESFVTGSVGDLVVDGTSGDMYIKNTGDGTNTGWVQVATSATMSNIYTDDGTISENRLISGTGGNQVEFNMTDGLIDSGIVYNHVSTLLYHDPGGPANRVSLEVGDSVIITDLLSNRGALYAADYSANFTDRTLVDKGYVDDAITDGVVNIYNTDGTLTGSRSIDGNGNHLWFNNLGAYGFYGTDAEIEYDGAILKLAASGAGQFEMGHQDSLFWYVTNTTSNFDIDVNNVDSIITDHRVITKGFEYAADYSTGFTNRSLVDKGYVDGAVSSGNIYGIDGTLTGDRTITSNGNALTFTGTSENTILLETNDGPGSSHIEMRPDQIETRITDGTTWTEMLHSPSGFHLQYNNGVSANMLHLGGQMVFEDGINNTGVVYGDDYSANFTARSLVDREYVDDHIGALTWQGALDNQVGGGNSFFMDMPSYEIDDDGASVKYEVKAGRDFSFDAPNFSFHLDDSINSFRFTDNRAGAAQVGVVYSGDYSANFVDRSLVDKGYVDSVTGSSTFLALTDTPMAYTVGSLLFTSGSTVTEDNANFFWDDTGDMLGIGTNAPTTTLHINSNAVNATALLTLANTAGDFQFFRVDATPESSVAGSIGDLTVDGTNGDMYIKASGDGTNTGWERLALASEVTGGATSISKTAASYSGSFSSGGYVGYQAANDICNTAFPGSHFCRTDEIIQFIAEHSIAGFSADAWIAEGPPGYTSNSNDCSGWTNSGTAQLGAYWAYDSVGGGKGWLVSCETTLPLSCCQ
ncbi:hypothetical protein K8R20_03260 [bacterium]|nr:hypothetical protein [bacterium]